MIKSIHFYGTFDGRGYKIENLKIEEEHKFQGLFGYNKGTIKNVGIESGNIQGKSFVGGIAAYSTGVIDKCYNKASISNKETVIDLATCGGICGVLDPNGIISRCHNYGTILLEGSKNFVSCSGICALPAYNTQVIDCLNSGDITVNSTGRWTYVGGVSGRYGRIITCCNTGNIKFSFNGETSDNGYSVGGISGVVAQESDFIEKCVNIGNVTDTTINKPEVNRVGSIVGGVMNSGGCLNCYWLKDSYDMPQYSDGVTHKNDFFEFSLGDGTTDLVKILGSNWVLDASGYPKLSWK